MKRIFLLCAVAFSMFAAEAQTTKKSGKKAKKTAVSAETKAKLAAAKLEEERQAKFEDERVERLRYDSLRHDNERLADARFDSERVATKEAKIKIIDSTNIEGWKSHATQQEEYAKAERSHNQLISAANLGTTQGRQVKDITAMYNDKAKMINDNVSITDEQKKEQLAALNTERRTKLKAVLGKSKERKLEKERKDLVKKNGAPSEDAWIDTAESVVKN